MFSAVGCCLSCRTAWGCSCSRWNFGVYSLTDGVSILQAANTTLSWPVWWIFPSECCKSLSLPATRVHCRDIVQHLHGASALLCGMWPCQQLSSWAPTFLYALSWLSQSALEAQLHSEEEYFINRVQTGFSVKFSSYCLWSTYFLPDGHVKWFRKDLCEVLWRYRGKDAPIASVW